MVPKMVESIVMSLCSVKLHVTCPRSCENDLQPSRCDGVYFTLVSGQPIASIECLSRDDAAPARLNRPALVFHVLAQVEE